MDTPSPPSERAKSRVHKNLQAVVACETCRKRRSKCDEKTPRCSLCQKLDVPCIYQEPKPTKKDNTLMLILQTLDSLNQKIDHVISPAERLLQLDRQKSTIDSALGTMESTPDVLRSMGTNGLALSLARDSVSASPQTRVHPQNIPSPSKSFQVPARRATEMHSLLAWPTVQELLECNETNLSKWDDHGHSQPTESWLVDISTDFPQLAVDPSVNILYNEIGVLALREGQTMNLNKAYVEGLCAAYFQSYHHTFPILDPHYFHGYLLPGVCNESFDEAHEESILVLLILALGSVAQEGATGRPFVDEAGRDTGIRGGTILRPPGHIFLTEARRRLGLALTSWNLITLQCCILFAIYYAQVARNLEFWRMTRLTGVICKSVIKTVVHWDTAESDQIARCFWVCCMFEGGLSGELKLDIPEITMLQDSIPLPVFLSDNKGQRTKPDEDLFIEYHFLAQITLRTLINRAMKSFQETRNLFHAHEQEERPSDSVTDELSRQLSTWRAHLPQAIAWNDQSIDDVAMSNSQSNDYADATTPLDPAITGMVDFKIVLNASLRTRYLYAEYIIWRPYIFRVLHSSQDPTIEEIESCRKALKACTLWPLTFATFHSQRRLIPHIYEYTHTFFGILLLLHVCSHNRALNSILESMPGASAVEISISLYLAWIRDMKVVHPLARWCWRLLRLIYKDHELVKDLEGVEGVE